MNTLLLHPSDVLFFRDGRPMSGSLSGHGAAWPLPNVINQALHAALHRADIGKTTGILPHLHDHRRNDTIKDIRLFGGLVTAGPFPVGPDGAWYFPRPLDAGKSDSTEASFLPLKGDFGGGLSGLADPLKYPAANTQPASKDVPKSWWDASAWNAYLGSPQSPDSSRYLSGNDFCDTEFSYGIGIDPATGTQDGEQFYSAHYLRLREGWRLGCLAAAMDKKNGDSEDRRDLIREIFPNNGTSTPIIAGGQQRVCTVRRSSGGDLRLPRGKSDGFPSDGEIHRVKWTLLTPAIFPEINAHPGGWLPSWVDTKGKVQLLDGPGKNFAKRHRLTEGKPISATLVSAIVGKPVPVTGYALSDPATPDREKGGPKSTHLAVPAGSVYYFECDGKAAAEALATALNWHGNGDFTTIQNRRSTLMGEKGFGLGVCAPWQFHSGIRPE